MAAVDNLRMAVQVGKEGVLLAVYVQPKAHRTECIGLHGQALKIRVAAPPIDGAANDELIRFLADRCSVPRTGISIQVGAHGRQKRVKIQGVTVEWVLARLIPSSTGRNGKGLGGVKVGVMCVLLLAACSGPHPVLYPNGHLQSVGKESVEQDIDACRQAAESAGAEAGGGKVGRVATNTAVGAGVGAASGAVGGAISGAAGRGSMIGAASGAVWGLLTGLFSAVAGPSSRPSQAYTNFVNRCLQEKGYEVTGWQ